MNELYREHLVKGRKTYRCEFCGATIDKGEEHYTMCGKEDGYFWSVRGHKDCKDFYEMLISSGDVDYGGDYPAFQELTEMIFSLDRDYVKIYQDAEKTRDAVSRTFNYYQLQQL